MSKIKLNEEQNYFGFDYYKRSMEGVISDANDLRVLLRYKNIRMVELNKTRALADIDCAISNLMELKEAINAM